MQQDSITAAKLELLKQCNVLDHSKGSTVRNRRTVHVIDKDTIYNPTREEQVANSLQLKNLRKANVVAKQGNYIFIVHIVNLWYQYDLSNDMGI